MMRTWMMWSVFGVVGCGEASKLPVGSTCGEPAECESGLCVANLCIDPVGCAEVVNPIEPGPLLDACLLGLSGIIVTPASVTAALGGRVEFEVQGTYAPARAEDDDDAPVAALTATVDVTALVDWIAPEGVLFSSEEPGVAVIGEGTVEEFSVEAILRVGEGEMEGEALRYLRASASVTIERAAGGEP